MTRKGKYTVMLGLLFLPFTIAISQVETIVGEKNNGSSIKVKSIINYTDICTFSLSPFYSGDFRECLWYINIYQRRASDKSAVKYAESADSGQYMFSFFQLFQEKGWPRTDEGYFWDTDVETGLVNADIICEIVDEDSRIKKFSLPVYLNLTPEKPILNILKLKETIYGNYEIVVEVYLPSTSAPIHGEWTITFYADNSIINYFFDKNFSCDNYFFENEGDGFIIKGKNSFGKTQSDFINVKTYTNIETNKVDRTPYIFPNLVQNKLYLYREKVENHTSNIVIYDSAGKQIRHVVMPIQQTTAIDVYSLFPGQYFLCVNDESGKKYILRFIKTN